MNNNLLFITNNDNNITALTQNVLSRKLNVTTVSFNPLEITAACNFKTYSIVVINIKYMIPTQLDLFNTVKNKILKNDTPLIIIGNKNNEFIYKELIKIPNSIDMCDSKLNDIEYQVENIYTQKIRNKKTLNKESKRRKKILIVDDDTIMLRNISSLLQPKFDVIMAPSGILALSLLNSTNPKPDLILLDYQMPGLDGKQTLAKIREIPQFANIPIVFLTGVNDKSMIISAVKLKPQGYILKNINPMELIKQIDTYLV